MVKIELDRTRELKFTFNAIADIEEKAGMGVSELFSEQRIGFHILRLLYSGGLSHEDETMTPKKAGELLQGYLEKGGSLDELGTKLTQAINESGIIGKN